MKCNEKGCKPEYELDEGLHILRCKKCKMTESDYNDKKMQIKWNKAIAKKNEAVKVTRKRWWS